MTCNDATMSLGVYLLGALEPAEGAEVEAHLSTCAKCREQLEELAALPSMLEMLRVEDVDPSVDASSGNTVDLVGASRGEPAITPSEDLYERFVANARNAEAGDELAQRRGRLKRFRLLAAAAAAVVVVGGGIGIGVGLSSSGPSQPRAISAAFGNVHMQVRLAGQTTGTALRIDVSGLPDDEHCQLIAVGKDGQRDMAGQWNATYSGKAQFWGSTSIPRADLAELVLLGTNGKPLVTASV